MMRYLSIIIGDDLSISMVDALMETPLSHLNDCYINGNEVNLS